MRKDREEFKQELLADFMIEAAEHQQIIVNGLLELEREPTQQRREELLDQIGREAHSLKGAARSVDRRDVERLCQAVETALAGLQLEPLALDPAILHGLHQAVDLLALLLANGAGDGAGDLTPVLQALSGTQASSTDASDERTPGLSDRDVETCEQADDDAARKVEPGAGLQFAATVRISTARLGSLLRQAEELVAVKSALGYYLAELRGVGGRQARWRRASGRPQTIRGAPRLRARRNRSDEFLDWQEQHFTAVDKDLTRLATRLVHDQHLLGRMVDELQVSVTQALLTPFSSLLQILPKMAYDLAAQLGKEVAVTILGGATEVDRRILEELKDPLTHIVRNCIDHGLELPDQRVARNRPRHGTITVTVTKRDDRRVLLQIADDGTGLDTGRTRAAAVRAGLLASDEAARLSESEAQQLIFAGGVSTSQFITDLSGRGLGMAIVAEKVARLGGTVTVESQLGEGTVVSLLLPLNLATFRGVVVRVGEHLLAVPTSSVARAVRIQPATSRLIAGRRTVCLDGLVTGLAALGEVLGLASLAGSHGLAPALVVVAGQRRIAFLVDEVIGEQEGLVKELCPQLARVRSLTGVLVLGDGRVVPVLDVPDLLDVATELGASAVPLADHEPGDDQPMSILLAEDSFTSRSLLRSILESAGYRVTLAVDGVEALTRLQNESFDLLVSDVEMPGLSGLELTARLRTEPRWAELPVVLVTSLGSAEDRARGLTAGANAYIVKSSFEQSNLLEVVRRLI